MVLKLSAMAFGVIACMAISVMMARRVGSAMAWKTSRLIGVIFNATDQLQIYVQLIGFQYCSIKFFPDLDEELFCGSFVGFFGQV